MSSSTCGAGQACLGRPPAPTSHASVVALGSVLAPLAHLTLLQPLAHLTFLQPRPPGGSPTTTRPNAAIQASMGSILEGGARQNLSHANRMGGGGDMGGAGWPCRQQQGCAASRGQGVVPLMAQALGSSYGLAWGLTWAH